MRETISIQKLTDVEEESPVTLAANEINEGKVQIYKADEEEYDYGNEDVSILENSEAEEVEEKE